LGLTVTAGTLDVTAANLTYHGPTNVNGGMLMVSATMPNTSAVNVAAVLDIVGANRNFSTPIVNNGSIFFTGGSGTLSSNIFPGPNLITGGDRLLVYSGELTFTSTNSDFRGNVLVAGGGTLNVAPGGYFFDNITFGQGITFSVGNGFGAGTLVVSGGTLVNQGGISILDTSPAASSLIITDGLLSCQENGVNGSGGIGIYGYGTISGGLLSITSTAVGQAVNLPSLSVGDSVGSGTMNISGGTVSADGPIIVGAGGNAGLLNQSGGLVNCGGSLALGYVAQGSSALPGLPSVVNLSGGTLNLAVPGGNGTLIDGYGRSSTVNISGSATVIVSKVSMGYLPTAYSAPAVSNTLNLNGGTLMTNAIVNSGTGSNTVNLNGGLLLATSNNLNFMTGITNAYVLAGGAHIDDGGNQIGIAENLQSGAVNDGGLTKSGAGLLVLGGSNTYNGGTTIKEGVLQVDNTAALGTGALAVNSGTLDLYGNCVTVAGLSGSAGAITDYGFSSGTSTITVSQSGSSNFGGQIVDGTYSQLKLAVTGGSLTLSGTNTYNGGTTVNGGTLIVNNVKGLADGSSLTIGDPLAFSPAPVVPAATAAAPAIAPVPEPGTLALLAAGAAAVLWCGRRRRAAR
jgi:autotransporter-associated beta strand protein